MLHLHAYWRDGRGAFLSISVSGRRRSCDFAPVGWRRLGSSRVFANEILIVYPSVERDGAVSAHLSTGGDKVAQEKELPSYSH